MAGRFTTTYAISAYHHSVQIRPGQSVQHYVIKSAFFSNQCFANVVCRLLNDVCRLLSAAKVETNTSFNQSLLTLFDLIKCIHMLLVIIVDMLV